MASIVRRADGRYQTAIQQDGVRKFIYGATEKEVKQKLSALQKGVAQSGGLPASGRKSVEDLLTAFLEAASPSLKPRTVYNYNQIARLYINPFIGGVWLSKLTPDRIQRLYTDLRKAGHQRAPQHAHMLLHRALKFAVLWRWLPENPADRVFKPHYQSPRKDVWSPEEARTFFEATADERYRPIWLLAAHSGCRISELLGLRWTEVSLEAGTITISRNLQRIGDQWVVSTPKTRSGQRTLRLAAEGLAVLREVRARQDQWKQVHSEEWEDNGLVFSTRTGRPIDSRNVQHRLRTVSTEVGVLPITCHQLRHLHATLLLAAKVPVPAVAARLGHANPSITMSIYAHAVASQDDLAAEAISKALGS